MGESLEKKLVKQFVDAFFVKRDIKIIEKLLANDLQWIGTGKDEYAEKKEDVIELLKKEMNNIPIAYTWNSLEIKEKNMLNDVKNFILEFKGLTLESVDFFMNARIVLMFNESKIIFGQATILKTYTDKKTKKDSVLLTSVLENSAKAMLESDIINNTVSSICVMDANTHELLYVNNKLKETYGVDDYCIGKKCYKALMGQDKPCDGCVIPKNKKDVKISEIYLEKSNKWMESYKELLVWNERLAFVCFEKDITLRKSIENELKDANNLLEKVLKTIPVPVYWKDTELKYLGCNKSFLEFIGNKHENDIVGRTNKQLFSNGELQELFEADDRVVKDGEFIVDDLLNIKTLDDDSKKIRLFNIPMYKKNEIIGLVGLFEDITEVELHKKRLEYLSYHDKLTGLYNLSFFNDKLREANEIEGVPISVIAFDADGLKLINDTFGHAAGNELLIKISKNIKTNLRKQDILARIGGDEFAALLINADGEDCNLLIERIRRVMHKDNMYGIPLSVSFGYSTKVKSYHDLNEILAEADTKMYKMKVKNRAFHRKEMIKLIQEKVFEKFEGRREHANEVSRISYELAICLGLSIEQCNACKIAGYYHDIGKIVVKEEIVNKKSNKLTKKEWHNIKRHSEISYSILNTSDYFVKYANIVYAHHERYDGKGYPKKLIGEKIPIESRIISVADAIDAMKNKRSYRKILSEDEIVKELTDNAGTQFDEKVVDVAVSLLQNN